MKKSIYFTILFVFTCFLVVAQPPDETVGNGSSFDMMSAAVGLVVGGALGFFGSKRMNSNK